MTFVDVSWTVSWLAPLAFGLALCWVACCVRRPSADSAQRSYPASRASLTSVLLPALILACLLKGLTFPHSAWAAGAEVLAVNISAASGAVEPGNSDSPSQATSGLPNAPEAESYFLSADIRFAANPRMEELLERGVPIYFVAEVEVYRPRWYWTDEFVFRTTQSVRLSYQALTRQYRVTRGSLGLSFSSLSEALKAVGTIRAWRFADSRQFVPKSSHDVLVRFRLDKTQLPKPFQLTMITEADWIPISEWKRFSFTPAPIRTAP